MDYAVNPGLLAVRVEAADAESLRRIQDLTSRLQKSAMCKHLTVVYETYALAAAVAGLPE